MQALGSLISKMELTNFCDRRLVTRWLCVVQEAALLQGWNTLQFAL